MTKAKLALSLLAAILLPVLWFNGAAIREQWEGAPAMTLQARCANPQLGCSFTLQGQAYRLSSDQPLRAGTPFFLTLEGPGHKVSASWQMQGMEMGPNRYQLQAIGDGQWRTRTALPVCNQQRQDWELHLLIDQHRVVLTLSERAE
ncbi:hypothetical protein [Chitinilyticum piscinae]|uniref:Uncharacterized protein n=1 Tax=Chitinilyticum piscinae TaxID=2866724 RepID=A0A8J7FJC2_9NEIS|nr:hypothetical protein [Chitinilyticum piscinae]MBE9610435.1 hypothetical protein [Chitinilyticum piscinae]